MKPFAILVLLLASSTAQSAHDPLSAAKSLSLARRRRGHHRGIDPIARPTESCAQAPRAGSQTETNTREISTHQAVAVGALIALNSGIVNGACLSGLLHPTRQASSAVTGAWTNSALGSASGDGDQFAFNAKCILSYCGGSLISGLVNPNPAPFEVSVPAVRAAMWIGSALLLASGRAAEAGSRDFIPLALAANGVTNSLTSTSTANLVRSAHFSGITSDIGTFLGQVLRGNGANAARLRVFATLGLAFWTGGYLSYSLAGVFGTRVLLFSSFLYLILGLAAGYL